MKFKTRLLVTFLTIVFLPLMLTALAFISIGGYLMNAQREFGMVNVDYTMMSDPAQTFELISEKVFKEVKQQIATDEARLEDTAYLNDINKGIADKASYILVRKGDQLYYAGNTVAADKIFNILPAYGYANESHDAGYYYNSMEKLVKQLDFTFSDGTEGSFFIITKIHTLISKQLLVDMFIAIILILLFTSVMLTRWIHMGVFLPVNELNMAMKSIARGNLEYMLNTDNKGEIGELYKNYEDMRLRLKETTDEKFEHEKQNRELISNISHDLKTPITAIKGYVEGIMDGVADTPEKMDKYIKTIYNKANDMDRLINELTVYSGIDSNRMPYHFHRINVADYFGDCIEEVGLDLESKNIELNYFNLVSPDTIIIADPEQLKRVISNIIGNSVKYLDKEKGVIDIRILDEVDSIRVEIEDNGKGIAAKDLSNIFERFYRTDASRNSSKGGSGIGLSIVKKIVEDHGGYIWATSKENEGTCLHFVFRKYREIKE
jgi:signal transduction histidine kinase